MKLLLDENLSRRLLEAIRDLFRWRVEHRLDRKSKEGAACAGFARAGFDVFLVPLSRSIQRT